MDAQQLADLRKSYQRAALDESDADADPLMLFRRWLEEALAAELPEPNAMTLATVGADGRPSTRVVLIKAFDSRGIVWYTNYQSRKGRELQGNPNAALQFHWVELERVVRIEGSVEKTSDAEVGRLFRVAPARFTHRRVGIAAERAHCFARSAGGECSQVRSALRIAAAAPASLGRLPPRPRRVGILAGAPQPPARPAALPPLGRKLAAPTTGTLNAVPAFAGLC